MPSSVRVESVLHPVSAVQAVSLCRSSAFPRCDALNAFHPLRQFIVNLLCMIGVDSRKTRVAQVTSSKMARFVAIASALVCFASLASSVPVNHHAHDKDHLQHVSNSTTSLRASANATHVNATHHVSILYHRSSLTFRRE